ncbi:hypothetical protein E2C01_067207 [Portunus trituberculatus]|uniref:Uncharacterized protein n=1 Tax=Portunus trituberculatus TaxID=210409 RepID=A0A5B7HWV3_PORTR|nr:hypothetical protein [Portunus trituberculatus]
MPPAATASKEDTISSSAAPRLALLSLLQEAKGRQYGRDRWNPASCSGAEEELRLPGASGLASPSAVSENDK